MPHSSRVLSIVSDNSYLAQKGKRAYSNVLRRKGAHTDNSIQKLLSERVVCPEYWTVATHARRPSSAANDAVGLHLYDAGGERIGLGAVVRDIDSCDAQPAL